MRESLGTILTAMVTPFDADLSLDEAALAALADHLLDHGSDGLVVAGTTGESPTLTDDEKERMFRCVVEVARGRGSVIAGTGSNDTAHSVHLTRRAEAAGVDAVLVVTPYYNKPPRAGLLAHFRAVAAATSLPLIIYNIPSRCVVDLPPELLAELAGVENIVAVKQANCDLDESRRLRDLCDLGLYAGNDDMLFDIVAMGGWGGICVSSHLVGERMHQVADMAAAGRLVEARALDATLMPLYKALFATTNPILVKAALGMSGRPVGGLRLPLVEASAEEGAALRRVLAQHHLV
jgi:4-hydroxy-tetrahydrodipicolinate synthase